MFSKLQNRRNALCEQNVEFLIAKYVGAWSKQRTGLKV